MQYAVVCSMQFPALPVEPKWQRRIIYGYAMNRFVFEYETASLEADAATKGGVA